MAREGELKERPKKGINENIAALTPVKTGPVNPTPEKSRKNINEGEYLKTLGLAKKGMEKRIPLNEMKPKEREMLLFPANFLEGRGVEVPKFGKESIFVTTGPNNGKFLNGKGETFSFVLSGNEILYSINDSPRESISRKGMA